MIFTQTDFQVGNSLRFNSDSCIFYFCIFVSFNSFNMQSTHHFIILHHAFVFCSALNAESKKARRSLEVLFASGEIWASGSARRCLNKEYKTIKKKCDVFIFQHQ